MPPAANAAPAERVAALEARCAHKTTSFEGASLAWRIWGGGAPLVLIHGGHGTWMHWFQVIEPLAQRMTVACMDLPGFGDSDALPPPADPFRLASALRDGLAHLFDRRTSFSIAGFSFGGVVAGHLAERLGNRAGFLGLIGSGGLGSERPDLPMRSRRRDMDAAAIADVHRHNVATLMIGDPLRVDDLAIFIQERNTAKRPKIVSRVFSRTDALADVLPKTACPVLAMWGDKDATVGPHIERRIALLRSALPGAEIALIPDCGHWAMYEQPESVAQLLLAKAARRTFPRSRR